MLVGAVGIETTHAWHFNDLRSRARTEKEGLGSPWNPYCRRNAAFFPMMLRTTLRFASRTALVYCLRVDVHRRSDISVPHQSLLNFQIYFELSQQA